MAFTLEETTAIQRTLDNYISRIRPKPEIRAELDIAYRIERQSVFICEIRPDMNMKIMTRDVAKTTFVRTENVWKIYWMRADLKWHAYEITNVKTLNGFIKAVESDTYGCFWG